MEYLVLKKGDRYFMGLFYFIGKFSSAMPD